MALILAVWLKPVAARFDLYECMARNFYFGADATMASGSAVFSALINEDAAAYGLTDAQAAAYLEVDAELQTAMRLAKTPVTRSIVNVARKNAAVKSMQRMAGDLNGICRATDTVTDVQLIALGLLPREHRTRRHVPRTPPHVMLRSVAGRIATIRVCDKNSATLRSKPFGAKAAQLFTHVGTEPPISADHYLFQGLATRTTATITFPDDVPPGATVWVSARWMSARGETGVASEPIQFNLPGGPATRSASTGHRIAA